MGYRIRILGTNLEAPILDDLKRAALPAVLETDEGVGDDWEALELRHEDGTPIALIEKDLVVAGQLGGEEIDEFIESVGHYSPATSAAWLKDYLPKVKVIYAFQFLTGTEIKDGFDRLHQVYAAIWNVAGGILQADAEGFSNEDGYTILWQFDDHVSGPWNCGVLNAEGEWVHFEMDLGDPQHREAFWRGEVPETAIRI